MARRPSDSTAPPHSDSQGSAHSMDPTFQAQSWASEPVEMFSDEGVDVKFPPHIRLWAAVLRRAAVDCVLYQDHENPKFKKIGEDADRWLSGKYDPANFNSFESVCDFLGLPKAVVRGAASRLTEEAARRQRGMEFGDE